jgi:hypothetical protein
LALSVNSNGLTSWAMAAESDTPSEKRAAHGTA